MQDSEPEAEGSWPPFRAPVSSRDLCQPREPADPLLAGIGPGKFGQAPASLAWLYNPFVGQRLGEEGLQDRSPFVRAQDPVGGWGPKRQVLQGLVR